MSTEIRSLTATVNREFREQELREAETRAFLKSFYNVVDEAFFNLTLTGLTTSGTRGSYAGSSPTVFKADLVFQKKKHVYLLPYRYSASFVSGALRSAAFKNTISHEVTSMVEMLFDIEMLVKDLSKLPKFPVSQVTGPLEGRPHYNFVDQVERMRTSGASSQSSQFQSLNVKVQTPRAEIARIETAPVESSCAEVAVMSKPLVKKDVLKKKVFDAAVKYMKTHLPVEICKQVKFASFEVKPEESFDFEGNKEITVLNAQIFLLDMKSSRSLQLSLNFRLDLTFGKHFENEYSFEMRHHFPGPNRESVRVDKTALSYVLEEKLGKAKQLNDSGAPHSVTDASSSRFPENKESVNRKTRRLIQEKEDQTFLNVHELIKGHYRSCDPIHSRRGPCSIVNSIELKNLMAKLFKFSTSSPLNKKIVELLDENSMLYSCKTSVKENEFIFSYLLEENSYFNSEKYTVEVRMYCTQKRHLTLNDHHSSCDWKLVVGVIKKQTLFSREKELTLEEIENVFKTA